MCATRITRTARRSATTCWPCSPISASAIRSRSGLIEVLNKIDLLGAGRARHSVEPGAAQQPDGARCRRATGEGCDALLRLIDRRLEDGARAVRLDVPLSDGKTLAWIYEHGEVLGRRDDAEAAHLSVRLSDARSRPIAPPSTAALTGSETQL